MRETAKNQPVVSTMNRLQQATALNSFIRIRSRNTFAGWLFVLKNSTAPNGFWRACPYVVVSAVEPRITDPGSKYRRRHK